MPLIKVTTSVKCDDEKKNKVVKGLSGITASGIGKPEMYVASVLEDNAVVAFGGEIVNGAFVEVKSIGGLNSSVNNGLATSICEFLQQELGIAPDRIYINFIDVAAGNWGWNGSTFG